MLLTEIMNNSISAIQRKRTAQENKQSAEAYTKALARLNKASETLKSSLKCAISLKEKGIVDFPLMDTHTRDDLVDCINSCGRGLYDGTLTSDMVSVLKAKSDAFAGQIQIVWKDASVKYSESIQGYLSLIGALTSNPKKASDLQEKIAKITSGALTEANIDSLIGNVKQAKNITDGFSLNSNIELFLKKVSDRKATILDLTPQVQKWLSDKGVSGKLRISFSPVL